MIGLSTELLQRLEQRGPFCIPIQFGIDGPLMRVDAQYRTAPLLAEGETLEVLLNQADAIDREVEGEGEV